MVAPMSSEITVSIQLNKQQAESYLRFLVRQYEQSMRDYWFADSYRYVPEGLRTRRIFNDHPHMAGINHTGRALRKQLRELGVQA